VIEVPDVDFFTFEVSAPRQDLGADRKFVDYRFGVLAAFVDLREFDTFQLDCTAGDAFVIPLVKTQVSLSTDMDPPVVNYVE
jgi:hypothetical protein